MSVVDRSIKTILAEDHGITLRKCPRNSQKRRLVRDASKEVVGCCSSFDALQTARCGPNACDCGHGADEDRYQ